MAESSLWTRLLEASTEDMLPTAYIDAPKRKFYFCKLYLLVPFSCVEKLLRRFQWMAVPMQNGSLPRDLPSNGMLVGLLLLLC
jgi:hypothetical protein